MSLPYAAALAKVDSIVASFGAALYGPRQERIESVRVTMRERRDYWHALGSRIRQRQIREAGRDK